MHKPTLVLEGHGYRFITEKQVADMLLTHFGDGGRSIKGTAKALEANQKLHAEGFIAIPQSKYVLHKSLTDSELQELTLRQRLARFGFTVESRSGVKMTIYAPNGHRAHTDPKLDYASGMSLVLRLEAGETLELPEVAA